MIFEHRLLDVTRNSNDSTDTPIKSASRIYLKITHSWAPLLVVPKNKLEEGTIWFLTIERHNCWFQQEIVVGIITDGSLQ